MITTTAINLDDFCKIWGVTASDIPSGCAERIRMAHTSYCLLTTQERDEHILHILKRLQEQKLARTTRENLQSFEAGWNENYELCLRQGVSLEALKPKYIKPYALLRYNGHFIAPENPFLLDDLISIATMYSFTTYLADAEHIYEFGCGTGRYLFELSELFSDKELFGLDWTESSQKILQLIADTGRNVQGLKFDMLSPSSHVSLKPRSAVVTIGAMEQLEDRFQPFLSYLLANKPEIVIHHEPIEEFYDEQNLFDYLALLYHRGRGYSSGYWTALQQLSEEGRIEILDARRLHFGAYHESVSFIAWRPIS